MMRRGIVAVLACGLWWGAAGGGIAAAPPAGDVTPDPKLRANRDTYHPALDVLKARAPA